MKYGNKKQRLAIYDELKGVLIRCGIAMLYKVFIILIHTKLIYVMLYSDFIDSILELCKCKYSKFLVKKFLIYWWVYPTTLNA